ncbi:MAG: hypothetical protein R3B90_21795 [Planctomycetaceae bacterium]
MLHQAQNRQLALPMLGETANVPQLINELSAAAIEYAKRTPALFSRGQTAELPGGRIKRRAQPLAIEPLADAKDVESYYQKALRVEEALATYHRGNKRAELLLQLVAIKLSPDKQHAAAEYKAKRLTVAQLKQARLKPSDVDRDDDGHNYSVEI